MLVLNMVYIPSIWSGIPFLAVTCCRGHCIAKKKYTHVVWGVRTERRKSYWELPKLPHNAGSEIGNGKSYILVWNKVRVFRTGRHTHTQKYYEFSQPSYFMLRATGNVEKILVHYITMAVASGGARGAVALPPPPPPVKKPPLKNNRNQNTYLNILGV